MDSTKQRQIVLSSVLLLSLVIWGYDRAFPEKPQHNNEVQASQLPEPQEPEKPQEVLPKAPDLNVLHIDTLPSPFALLPTAVGSNYTMSASPPGVPPIPSIDFPQISSGTFPAFSPAQNGYSYLQVKAILYRPGKVNVAIFNDGAEDTMVVEGNQSPWGYVSSITASTVVVQGKTLVLSYTGEIRQDNSITEPLVLINRNDVMEDHLK